MIIFYKHTLYIRRNKAKAWPYGYLKAKAYKSIARRLGWDKMRAIWQHWAARYLYVSKFCEKDGEKEVNVNINSGFIMTSNLYPMLPSKLLKHSNSLGRVLPWPLACWRFWQDGVENRLWTVHWWPTDCPYENICPCQPSKSSKVRKNVNVNSRNSSSTHPSHLASHWNSFSSVPWWGILPMICSTEYWPGPPREGPEQSGWAQVYISTSLRVRLRPKKVEI